MVIAHENLQQRELTIRKAKKGINPENASSYENWKQDEKKKGANSSRIVQHALALCKA